MKLQMDRNETKLNKIKPESHEAKDHSVKLIFKLKFYIVSAVLKKIITWNQLVKGQCVHVFDTVPVNSVNAHDERLYIRVGGTAELAAGLSTEWGAII